MLALTLQHGKLDLDPDYPTPVPGPGEALLRVRLAGICGTDLALAEGYKGGFSGVLGHEYVAEVVQAPGNEQWLGRRVVGEINTTCGDCERCRRGLSIHCANRRVLGIINWDGAFAEYLLSPVDLLHPVPDELPDELAVFAEPVAAAFAAVRDLPPELREQSSDSVRVIIFGAGRLGQLIAQAFHAEGYAPLLVGRHEQKLAVARESGLQTLKISRALKVSSVGEFDVAVDATGNPHALADICACLRPRGVLILKTTSAHTASLDLSPVVVNELRMIGSRCGPFPRALAALAHGEVDPRPLIAARYPLSEGLAAFEQAKRRGVLKILVG